MATTDVDKRTAFAGGVGEELEVKLNRLIRHVQISCDGFDLENATVEIIAYGSTTRQTVTFSAGTGKVGVIEDFLIDTVIVSGLAAGSYHVTVSQTYVG